MKKNGEQDSDFDLLQQYIDISERIKLVKKDLKVLNAGLEKEVLQKYTELSVDEIKDILINKKWMKSIYDGIDDLYTEISHNIANRIIELVERYEFTLSELQNNVDTYKSKVEDHLKKMGFSL